MDSISWFVFLFYRLCLQPCPAWLVHFGVAPTLLVPLEEMLEMLEVEVPRLSRASLPRDATCVNIMSNRRGNQPPKARKARKCWKSVNVCDLRCIYFFYLRFCWFLNVLVPCCGICFYHPPGDVKKSPKLPQLPRWQGLRASEAPKICRWLMGNVGNMKKCQINDEQNENHQLPSTIRQSLSSPMSAAQVCDCALHWHRQNLISPGVARNIERARRAHTWRKLSVDMSFSPCQFTLHILHLFTLYLDVDITSSSRVIHNDGSIRENPIPSNGSLRYMTSRSWRDHQSQP